MWCTPDHEDVPKRITQVTGHGDDKVEARIDNPALRSDDTWGWVHHPSAGKWHTLAGTVLREEGNRLVAINDGPPQVDAVQAIDLTR